MTGSKTSISSTKIVHFGLIRKPRWPPWPLIGWDTFDFSETAKWNSTKLNRKKDLKVLYQVCVLRLIWKPRWPPWPQVGWDTHDFSKTAEWNSTKLIRKQDLKVLYQVCVFWGWLENQDGHPGLWLAETFSTSFFETAERNLKNFDRRQVINIIISMCFTLKRGTHVHDCGPVGLLFFYFVFYAYGLKGPLGKIL